MNSGHQVIPFPVPIARNWRIVRAAILERLMTHSLSEEAVAHVLSEMEVFWRVLSAPINIDFSAFNELEDHQKVRTIRASTAAGIDVYQANLMLNRLNREIALALELKL